MRHALIGVPCFQQIINLYQTRSYTYHQLYSELRNALESTLEGKEANRREEGDEGDATAVAATVQYANQGTYGHPNKGVGATVKGGGQKIDPLSITGCFNCDASDHMARDCKQKVDLVKAAKRRLD